MRKSILSAVAGVTFLLGIAACSEENKYDWERIADEVASVYKQL